MTGTGGLYTSGRWHNKGVRILYFSEHVSLAKLEVLTNANSLLKNMCLLTVSILENVSIETKLIKDLPKGWDTYPYTHLLSGITAKWLSSNKTAILKVPSAQSENEYNYLINPLHVDATKITIVSTEKVTFDSRLQLR